MRQSIDSISHLILGVLHRRNSGRPSRLTALDFILAAVFSGCVQSGNQGLQIEPGTRAQPHNAERVGPAAREAKHLK
jgi:hypothetical protein